MLLILMYHQILNPAIPQAAELFTKHINYLHANYPILLPGQPLQKNRLNVCLTFDDAYYDFYHYVFPLLQQLQIPAVLGVPTKFIQVAASASDQQRLSVAYPLGLDPALQQLTPLCTWAEIKTMAASGLVQVAAHGHSHSDLTRSDLDLADELQTAKKILTEQLQLPINTLIYPFGRTSQRTNKLALQHFSYAMRIGAASNIDWQHNHGLLYRVNADLFWQKNQYISNSFLLGAKLKYWFNTIRNK